MTESATGPAVAASHRRQQNIFVSYARQDRDRITSVVEGLRPLGNDVWLDEELSGGQACWDTVLQEIRECDVFVQAITPSSARLYERYLPGRKGNRWAWENGRRESVDLLRVSQRTWATWGVVVVAFLVVVVIASGSSGS